MQLRVLKSKIHRATVKQAALDYVGSITVDKELLDASGILEYEEVQIVDVNNGNRFSTYTIAGEEGSGIDFKKRKYTYHRNRSRSRLRRTNFGLPRYAWYVLRFYTEICKEVRGNRRCNESGI